MSPIRVTWRRTVSRSRSLVSTAVTVTGFLMTVAAVFAFRLEAAEGSRLGVASVWASSVSMFLPVLAVLLAMDVWSEERFSGRLDLLLTTPVRERDFVIGKFLGVWTLTTAVTLVSLAATLALLNFLAPSALQGASVLTFAPGVAALALQSALWCALSLAASAMFRHSAAAACAGLIILVALPRSLWYALVRWSPTTVDRLDEMPFDVHAFEMSAGAVSLGVVASYLVFTLFALFVTSKIIAVSRYHGRGAARARFAVVTVSSLSLAVAVLASLLALRVGWTLELPVARGAIYFSPRTLSVLREARGQVSMTCFLPRSDRRFREVAHFLRALKRTADACAGVRIDLHFTDPRWDLAAATRLTRSGARSGTLVCERNGRQVLLSVDGEVSERQVTSAVENLALSPQRRQICWTTGHGESAFDDYGGAGLSDIARELARDGYVNRALDLAQDAPIRTDCALVVVAGAREDFSRIELSRLDAYLRQGGRLLVLLDGSKDGAVASMLPSWGVRPLKVPLAGLRTLSGGDVVLSEFSEHPAVRSLKSLQLVLDAPVALEASSAALQGAGADRLGYTALVGSGERVFAAAVERGAGAGSDTVIMPMRLIVVGDSSFVTNLRLQQSANANRDFFLGCVAYLAGAPVLSAGRGDADLLVTGLDRDARRRFLLVSALAVPLALSLLALVTVAIRRRR